MDYSAFYDIDTAQSHVFCDSWYTLLGIFRFYVSLGIITYPRHLNKIIWGIIGDMLDKDNIPLDLLLD